MSTATTIDCLQTKYFSADDLVVEWVTWPLEQAGTANCTASTSFRNLRQYDSLLRIINIPSTARGGGQARSTYLFI